jgi:hypothetical protein
LVTEEKGEIPMMIKKTFIFLATMMMLVFGISTSAFASSSTMSEIEATEFFKACDLNEDGILNVCDLLIAKRSYGNKMVKAITKYLTKQPINFTEDMPTPIGSAISLYDLRYPDTSITIDELNDQIANSDSTDVTLEKDESVLITCHYDTADTCYQLYTMTKETFDKQKVGSSTRYTRNGVSVELFADKDNMIYLLVDDNTSFPFQLKWNKSKTADNKTIIRISNSLNGLISEPIEIDFNKKGTTIIPVKFDNGEVYEAVLEITDNAYRISELPMGSKIVK